MNHLIDLLSGFESPNVFNPWRHWDPMDRKGPELRRELLTRHFECPSPLFLLVGEAPGYQGCRFSGIPFTSERLLMEWKVPRIRLRARLTWRNPPWSEPSATTVWRVLDELQIAERTVLWNAFAFHPHRHGVPYSNRAPTAEELAAGAPILHAVIKQFEHAAVVAVGRTAEALLAELGVTVSGSVRHPSMGGAARFESELKRLVGK